MPRYICPTCQAPFKPHKVGVVVEERYDDGETPYRWWNADIHVCECRPAGCPDDLRDGLLVVLANQPYYDAPDPNTIFDWFC